MSEGRRNMQGTEDLGIIGKDFRHYEMPNFTTCISYATLSII